MNKAIERIEAHDQSKVDNPLFLFYSFVYLHTPLQAPKKAFEQLDALVLEKGGVNISTESRRSSLVPCDE